jgi:hypothetical protein
VTPLAQAVVGVAAVSVAAVSASSASGDLNAAHHRVPYAASLTVIEVQVPPLRVENYDTTGTYPTVRRRGLDLRDVNSVLRSLVAVDQREYRARIIPLRRRLIRNDPPLKTLRGTYDIRRRPSQVLATTTVVSVLLTRRAQFEGYTDDEWLSSTVKVPSGEAIELGGLFARSSVALAALGRAWRIEFRRQGGGECLDTYPQRDVYPSTHWTQASDYRHFALTPNGIAIAIDRAGFCSPRVVTVRYRVLRRYFGAAALGLVQSIERRR